MKRACVIGWPIKHSRSPLIHGYWLKKYGIDGSYTKEAVPPDQIETFLRSLAERGYAGCNVTVPYKEHALRAADRLALSAEVVGAANTLWFQDGELWADNTDRSGFMANFTSAAPTWQSDGPIAILGAGGAAKAIIAGMAVPLAHAAAINPHRPAEIRVINRTLDRARELTERWSGLVKPIAWEDRIAATRDVKVIINTTTLGMAHSDPLDFDVAHLHADCIVADIVYVPLETELLKNARARGLATVDGLGMLLHQAVPGFERWFGVRPEVTPELRELIVADIQAHG